MRKPATTGTPELPLRNHAERALSDYLASLNGHRPARLYDMVLREVEEPLFRTVMDYTEGNQVRAASILGSSHGWGPVSAFTRCTGTLSGSNPAR